MPKNSNCLDGLWCPACGSEGSFNILVTSDAKVFDDGVDEYQGAEWENDSPCTCNTCGESGTIDDFRTPEAPGAADNQTWEPGTDVWLWPYLNMEAARGRRAAVLDEFCPSCGKKSLVHWRGDDGEKYESCLNGCCSQLSRKLGPIG